MNPPILPFHHWTNHTDGCQGSIFWERLPFRDERGVLMEYPEGECVACGQRDCPYEEPFHYHHDGCPGCVEHEVPDDLASRLKAYSDRHHFTIINYPAFRDEIADDEDRCSECLEPHCGCVCPAPELLEQQQ